MNKTIELAGTDFDFEEALDHVLGHMEYFLGNLYHIEENFPEKVDALRNSSRPDDWDDMTREFHGALDIANRVQNWFREQSKEEAA